jgi:uncharacterized membrane protein
MNPSNTFSAPTLHTTGSARALRRVGAVLAGLVTVFVVTTVTDIALHALEVFPPWGQDMSSALYALAAAYRVVFGILGGYVTARLAPDSPVVHALALGAVGFAISVVGSVVMWGMGPLWYMLAVIAMAIPCSWLGGVWAARA